MDVYEKIHAPFKRNPDQSFIWGQWSTPEIEYLKDSQWEFTEKVNGTNIRIGLHLYGDSLSVEFGGRSDNAMLPKPLLAWLQENFKQSPSGCGDSAHIGLWMLDNDLTNVTLYGEGFGPDIHNGGLYGQEQKFVLFDVKIDGWWLDRANVDDVASQLGIESVPVVGHGTLQDGFDMVSSNSTFDYFWDSGSTSVSGLRSHWGLFEAEGIVARPVVQLFNRKGIRVATKIKAVDFK